MFKVETEQWPISVTPHYKIAIYHIIYEGPVEGVVTTGLSSVLFASAINPRTGKRISTIWEKGNSCVLLKINKNEKGIIKLKVEGW